MIWRRVTENTLGGNYTWYDAAVEGIELRPLIYCVGNAFPAREVAAIEHHLEGLFELGGAGGDPDWQLFREVDDLGKISYHASSLTRISGLEPPCGHYEEALVKKYFARTMREYARVHPESNGKIEELIEKYQLEPQTPGAPQAEPTAATSQEIERGFWRKWFKR